MNRSPLVLAAFAVAPFVLAVACGGKPKPATSPDDMASAASTDSAAPTDMPAATDSAAPSAAPPASSSATVPPPPPAHIEKSKLTAAQLKAAQKSTSPGQPYDAAMGKLTTLGPAQRTADNTSYWYAVSGKECLELQIEKAGDKVGAVGITKGYKKNDSVSLKGGSTFRPWDYCEGK